MPEVGNHVTRCAIANIPKGLPGFGSALRSLVVLAATSAVASADLADSTSSASRRMPSRDSWERIVSFPGDLVYIPFGVVFTGMEHAIDYDESTGLRKRIRERLRWDEGRKSIVPAFRNRSGFGLTYIDRDWQTSFPQFMIAAMVGPRWRHGALLTLARPAGDESWRLRLGVDYRWMPDESFWGVGPATPEGAETTYRHVLAAPFAQASRRASPFSVTVQAGLEHSRLGNGADDEWPGTGEVFGRGQVPGVGTNSLLGNLLLTLEFDTRNHLGTPTGGWRAAATTRLFFDLGDDDFRFVKVSGEALRFVEIYRQRVLMFRLGATIAEPLGEGSVPFFRLSEIGDEATTLRGFDRGRYRDRHAVFGGVEYRYPIWRVLDGLWFVNAGQVARNLFHDLDGDLLRVSYGPGIRLWRDSGVASRVLLSRSSDGTSIQVYLTSTF